MSDIDRISEIEHLIATGKMTAAQVFTQMKQLLKPSGTPTSWEPVAWCFTDVNGKPKELTDSPETKSEQDMRIYMPLYNHPPAKVPEAQGFYCSAVICWGCGRVYMERPSICDCDNDETMDGFESAAVFIASEIATPPQEQSDE